VTDTRVPGKPGVCEICDEPTQSLQDVGCECCGLSIGLWCAACEDRSMRSTSPNLCRKCADEEDKHLRDERNHDPTDHDRKYDAWKDGTFEK
jgi:hypothetical protein